MQKEFHAKLRPLFEAVDKATSRSLLNSIIEEYSEAAPKAIAILEKCFEDSAVVLNLPERYRKRLRTTNSTERLNQEIRRRERVIRIFPNQESAERLVGALLMEQHETWSTGHRYFNMDDYWEWKKQQRVELRVANFESKASSV